VSVRVPDLIHEATGHRSNAQIQPENDLKQSEAGPIKASDLQLGKSVEYDGQEFEIINK